MFKCDFASEMNERLDNTVRIKELREKAKMSQGDFARICFNVTADKLKFWEDNNYTVLDLTVDELSHFLEFTKRWSDVLSMRVL